MKILLTGGGTGGHFYPLIAIAEKLNILAEEQKILNMKLYYMSNTPYDSTLLFENGITYVEVPAGKMRIYFSLRNIVDIFRAGAGAFWGLVSMFFIYPDVVISKGGYAAFPAVFAAKILRIPVVLHESDSVPGRLNTWTGRFAEKIAVSWPEAAQFFDTKKTAVTGQPIRRDILTGSPEGAHAYFNLDPAIPTIMVIGGSQGAEKINNAIIDILPELITRYQIIHQTGKIHFEDVSSRARFVTETSQYASRYHPVAYLHTLATRKAVGASSLVISRAGSALFEIASWGLPSIIIPIEHSHGNHQHKNAFTYARSGACEVIEEPN
ncbi:MAG: UDP-N-acetylglucosamine--N-acetylmuramyl-(pentapeptide) pyrophosphoryl-undecaprenol N-acetylglucosamine transferase, partial [Candidatus Pacebacteria bacterium]|nr:UDP-N-acetylglucosamine--N-acetylmuramyl-(pentapeptide) pyrophosphoryl-undecaprenol N-acetylglucosamine transferase [Candidatus Paceibacterota bacterium]